MRHLWKLLTKGNRKIQKGNSFSENKRKNRLETAISTTRKHSFSQTQILPFQDYDHNETLSLPIKNTSFSIPRPKVPSNPLRKHPSRKLPYTHPRFPLPSTRPPLLSHPINVRRSKCPQIILPILLNLQSTFARLRRWKRPYKSQEINSSRQFLLKTTLSNWKIGRNLFKCHRREAHLQ